MKQHGTAPVLILGGYGSLGSSIARMLRQLHPQLPITIAGRSIEQAAARARQVGVANAVTIDLGDPSLGLSAGNEYSIVVTALRDTSLNSLRYAQERSIPYMALSDAPFELGPLVARFTQAPLRSAVMLLGHSIGGVPTLAALHLAKEFAVIESIDIGLIFDPGDPFGPMSARDMQHIAEDGPPPLMLRQGVWRWGDPGTTNRKIIGAGGTAVEGQAVGLLDVLSLVSVATRGSIRVDAAEAYTRTSRDGGKPSHEVIIEIAGRKHDGGSGCQRCELIDKEGYAALSARGISIAVERMLGLSGGAAPPAGLYFPETVMDPGYFVERLKAFGIAIAPDAMLAEPDPTCGSR